MSSLGVARHSHDTAPDLVLPPDMTEAEALALLESGAGGRLELEHKLRYTCCTIGGCLLPAGHIGSCRVPIRSTGRKKKARTVFEVDDDKPQALRDPKRMRKPSSAKTVPTAKRSEPAAPAPVAEPPQTFHAGDTSLQELSRNIELVPNMRAAPGFLNTNAQAHPNPFSPIADLMDNGIEAKATEMRLGIHKVRNVNVLTMVDNGRGMSERVLLDGPLSLAYTSKAGSHYGMGATTSIPAIGGFSLIFSIGVAGHRTVGLLSSKLSATVEADQTKMPQCTWVAASEGFALLDEQSDDAPLGVEARRASLQLIMQFSPYKTEAELLTVFAEMPPSGTRLVIWDLSPCYRAVGGSHDIVNAKAPADSHPHVSSLRALLEVLYYTDDDHPAPLTLWLMGARVVPRNWTAFLHTSRRYALPKNGGSSPGTFVEFGHRVPIKELVDNFKSRTKKDHTLQNYMGVFYYNKDQDKIRLIVPLELSRVQKPMEDGKIAMAVTQRRICEWGFGLIGVCVESHLRPAHNKSEYVSQATNSEVHALMKAIDERMRRHLKDCITEAFRGAVGMSSAEGASAQQQLAAMAAEKTQAKAPPPARFIEGERVRATDGLIGRVCLDPSARGYYRLQLADGSVFQGYRGAELTVCIFDPATEMPRGFREAEPQLDGCKVEVYWLSEDGCGGQWEKGRLANAVSSSAGRGESSGWFTILYENTDELDPEQLFVALPVERDASDEAGAFFAARNDGEQLWPGRDIRIRDEDLAKAAPWARRAGSPARAALVVHEVIAEVVDEEDPELVPGSGSGEEEPSGVVCCDFDELEGRLVRNGTRPA